MVELKIMQIIGTSSPFFTVLGKQKFFGTSQVDHPNDLTTHAITINDVSRGTTNVFFHLLADEWRG